MCVAKRFLAFRKCFGQKREIIKKVVFAVMTNFFLATSFETDSQVVFAVETNYQDIIKMVHNVQYERVTYCSVRLVPYIGNVESF
jgi:hypothetical protein